jgi:hypothetical protein
VWRKHSCAMSLSFVSSVYVKYLKQDSEGYVEQVPDLLEKEAVFPNFEAPNRAGRGPAPRKHFCVPPRDSLDACSRFPLRPYPETGSLGGTRK